MSGNFKNESLIRQFANSYLRHYLRGTEAVFTEAVMRQVGDPEMSIASDDIRRARRAHDDPRYHARQAIQTAQGNLGPDATPADAVKNADYASLVSKLKGMGIEVPADGADEKARGKKELDYAKRLGKSANEPFDYEPTLVNSLRKSVEPEADLARAYEEIGLDTPPEEAAQMLKSKGVQILPDDRYIKAYGVQKLRRIREKAERGEALLPSEQQIFDVWYNFNQEMEILGKREPKPAAPPAPQQEAFAALRRLIESIDTSSMMNDKDAFDELIRRGINVISQEEAEAEHLRRIQSNYDMTYRKYGDDTDASHNSRWRKSAVKWSGDERNISMNKMKPDDQAKMKGLQQYKAGGEINPFEVPLRAPKPSADLISRYDQDKQLLADEILLPACRAVVKAIRYGMSQIIGYAPSMTNVFDLRHRSQSNQKIGAFSSYTGSEGNQDIANGWCGADPSSDRMVIINSFLQPYYFEDVVSKVAERLKNSPGTGLQQWSGPEGEGIRYGYARMYALNILTKITEENQMKRGNVTGNRGSGFKASGMGGQQYTLSGGGEGGGGIEDVGVSDTAQDQYDDQEWYEKHIANATADDVMNILRRAVEADDPSDPDYLSAGQRILAIRQVMKLRPELAESLSARSDEE